MKKICGILVLVSLLVGCSEQVTEEEITKAVTDKVESEINKAVNETVDKVKQEGKETAEGLIEDGSNKLSEWLSGTTDTSSETNETREITHSNGSVEEYEVEYISNYDGDTLKVRFLEGDSDNVGKTLNTRLLLVDSSELKDRNSGKPQPYSKEARDRAKELLNNAKTIKASFDIGSRFDHYDRALLYISIDGKLLQTTLAEEGLVMVRYINAPNTRHLDEIKAAEGRAKEKGIGIWSIEDYATSEKGFTP
ncbi:thermonuclease family protein [Psychrobacillus sp. FSL K6-4615]|uniref:thermonuclease family protein n=1 Tax=Psychrobacillus sp. FSL K6-4615 TaxID=2921551 RepID=UPI0030F8EA9A